MRFGSSDLCFALPIRRLAADHITNAWQTISFSSMHVSLYGLVQHQGLSTSSSTDQSEPQQQSRSQKPLGYAMQDQDPDVEPRKQAAVKAFFAKQFGSPEHAELAQLLQSHGVIVKGGHEQAMQLLNALMAWKTGQGKPAGDRATS